MLAVGGTISGEHGDGLSRTPFIRRQYGPLADVFREVKQIFDPQQHFQSRQDRRRRSRPADAATCGLPCHAGTPTNGRRRPAASRRRAVRAAPSTWQLQLERRRTIAQAARACNGCGACRSQLADVRMCPIFRFAPAEESLAAGQGQPDAGHPRPASLPPATLTSDEFKAVADLCVNCHMCRLECPASVDIPKLMIEAKATVRARPTACRTSDWLLSRLDLLELRWAACLAPLANWALANRPARWLLEKTARHRPGAQAAAVRRAQLSARAAAHAG